MSIKLVAIDIDGTLLNEKREVTKEVKEAIAAAVAKGVSIVLCTATVSANTEAIADGFRL